MDEEFEKMVTVAVSNIPKKYADKLSQVAIVVRDEPSADQLEKLQMRRGHSLFGLYEGVPLTKRGGQTLSIAPGIITIFKYPMVDFFEDKAALQAQINETVWHEVAHYFGLDHAQIDRLKR